MQEASQDEPPGIAPLPPRPRYRRVTIAWLFGVTVVLVAAIATGIGLVSTSATQPQSFYTGMPAPCTMVPQPAGGRIRNMAEPAGGTAVSSGQKQTGYCSWVGFTRKGNQEMLQLEVNLYRSASKARQAYDSDAPSYDDTWAPDGVTQSPWGAPGLGDQAIGQLAAGEPQAGDTTAVVWVQSGNAEVWISFYSGDWSPSTGDNAKIQTVIAMIGHILGVLHEGTPG